MSIAGTIGWIFVLFATFHLMNNYVVNDAFEDIAEMCEDKCSLQDQGYYGVTGYADDISGNTLCVCVNDSYKVYRGNLSSWNIEEAKE